MSEVMTLIGEGHENLNSFWFCGLESQPLRYASLGSFQEVSIKNNHLHHRTRYSSSSHCACGLMNRELEKNMATQIEFVSDLDGRDLVPVRYNVFSTLKHILSAFRKEGYSIAGGIEYVGKQFVGEYRAVGRGERVTFHVVNV